MIKDILVLLDNVGERAGPYALGLARVFDAALSGVCVAPEPSVPALPYVPVDLGVYATARDEAIEMADAVKLRFEAEARQANLTVECTSIVAEPVLVSEQIRQAAGLSDLCVIEQSEPGRAKPGDLYLDALLIHSGRPTLLVPYTQVAPPRFAHATVAWDGSSTAARALADAIPLLRRAGHVEVVSVVRVGDEEDESFAPKLVRHLARHGIEASFRRLTTTIPIAETLLSRVADSNSDLLVLGAYGHSRVREALLGGTSRTILQAMTLPVLMSH